MNAVYDDVYDDFDYDDDDAYDTSNAYYYDDDLCADFSLDSYHHLWLTRLTTAS